MSEKLKLIALDEEDLTVLSSLVQDAIINSDGILFERSKRQLTVQMRRYAWELPGARRRFFAKKERRLSILHFNRVISVSSKNIDRGRGESGTLSLLAIHFEESKNDDASGTVNLIFAGDCHMRVEVENIEAQLSDLDARWQAGRRPSHFEGSGDGET